MKIKRLNTKPNESPYDSIKFRKVSSEIRNPDGSIVRIRDIGRTELGTERYDILGNYNGKPVGGMAIRKEMLKRRGLIGHSAVRPPAPPIDTPTQTMLDTLLDYYKEKDIPWI